MAMTLPHRMTVEEFIDASAGVQRPAELIDGVMVVSQPRFRHQDAVARILVALRAWSDGANGRGAASLPLDVELDDHNVYGPDVLWYRDIADIEMDGFQQRVPDLVVEVRSPSTWHYDVGVKRRTYEYFGLPELWLVDTDAGEVRVLRRSGPDAVGFDVELKIGCDEVLTSPQLPGFELPLDDVFRF
ncbi:MAG TPA: Uma2 family endonuclease [Acidimicrobiales bacterium]|jgi:Uma2 family endonuclease